GLQRFRELGMNPSEIRLTGGGSQSAVWRQIAADIFNAEVVTLATAEGAALGSAIQAAYALKKRDGKAHNIEELTSRLVTLDESTRCRPDPARVALYARMLEDFSRLTQRLREVEYL
ncbi:MAG TPA: FGGY-family carbohydrate kinase, partial [Candidatus Saccharimonadia bacterium]|nr:FGGY-family carbohydrate kinase [Candidatus Saccharimonadia bacterium]